ncbi:MAG: metallophosphoesterase family protein [Actinomycetota bacterium]|nr:metallophosphoesterase family protein [Actinomycetota bacterium]
MKYAIISDIHSNLEGLWAVLAEAEREGVDGILCCGDTIGYNADPNACVDLVREKKVRCIRGNHERGLEDLEEGRMPNMNAAAMQALHFTYKTLSEDRREWLLSLPDQLQPENSFYIFHGSPSHPDEYIFNAFEAAYAFKSLITEYPTPGNQLCLIGHTHVCAAYAFDREEREVRERNVRPGEVFAVDSQTLNMFNVGSCGQYRGGIPAATMGILDCDNMTMEFRFLEYDYPTSQEKIVDAGLPLFLAQRLGMGQ